MGRVRFPFQDPSAVVAGRHLATDRQVGVDRDVADAPLLLGEKYLLAPVCAEDGRLEAAVKLLIDEGVGRLLAEDARIFDPLGFDGVLGHCACDVDRQHLRRAKPASQQRRSPGTGGYVSLALRLGAGFAVCALGHSHGTTTSTSSPLPRSTETNLRHSRFPSPLSIRKNERWLSTPALAASSAVMPLKTRTERALATRALRLRRKPKAERSCGAAHGGGRMSTNERVRLG